MIANPPFNDSDWSGDLLRKDGRWKYGVPPSGNANYAWIQHFLYHLKGYVDVTNTRFVDESVVKSLGESKFKLKSGDFLIAMTGAEIGKIGIVQQTEKSFWVNQRVGKLISKVPYGNIIGYLALKSIDGQDHIKNACSGSAQENISSHGIEAMPFVIYDKKTCDNFGKTANLLFERITFNLNQICTLEKLRDTLLPKLMSGEVRVAALPDGEER